VPDAVPAGGGAGVVLTGDGVGFAVGFALADLVGVGVAAALVGAFVDDAVALDELAANAPAPDAVVLEAAALESAAPEAVLDPTAEADDATPLALPGGGPVGAAW